MENVGDWLYIVLLVIAGLSGLLSSGKKKKQQTNRPVPSEPDIFPEEQMKEPKSFWELFDEVQKEQPPQRVEPKPQQLQQKHQTAKKISYHTPIKQIEVSDDDAFNLSLESFNDTEELKKAIIYSEILNRKY